MSETYQGSCHCGAIAFSYEGEKIEKGLRCNCSICSRKGAMMSTEVIPEEKLHIKADKEALGLYKFGRKTAKHFFCYRCGIYPFHETARAPGYYRVNLGCIEGIDTLALQADMFDGKHKL